MSTEIARRVDTETGEITESGPFAMTVQQTVEMMRQVQDAKERVLIDGSDYAVIPGTGKKPALLKPGAEKLTHLFGYRLIAMRRTETYADPLGYAYEATLANRDGQVVAVCEGMCDASEKGRSTNPRNTLAKMAQKRALVGAVLIACAASALFTQDIEDYAEGEHAHAPKRPAKGGTDMTAKVPVWRHRADQLLARGEREVVIGAMQEAGITSQQLADDETWERAQEAVRAAVLFPPVEGEVVDEGRDPGAPGYGNEAAA